LRAAERAGDALTPKIQFAVYERLGRTYMALEQREETEIIYSRLRDVMQSRGDPIAEGYALVSLANVRMRLYQLELAEKAADEALKIGERTGDLRLLTYVHAYLGGLLITRGQLDPRTHHYKQALQNTDLLGDSGQLIDMLRLSAYRSTWIGHYQVEVLQLVAKGASNRQVADALHISVRTVNTHMTNILNKIGLENRTAATAFALQLPTRRRNRSTLCSIQAAHGHKVLPARHGAPWTKGR
jgi:DNA-binding CsgD family transcriptional regulator